MKSRRAAAFAAISACAIALGVSCWAPPFDPALSVSVRFEKKLEKVLSIGPIRYEGIKAKGSYFVPTYEVSPEDGYWVRREAGSSLAMNFVYAIPGNHAIGPAYRVENNNYGDLNAVQGLSPATAADPSISPISKGMQVFGTGETRSALTSPAMLGLGMLDKANWQSTVEAELDGGFSALGGDHLLAIGGSMQNISASMSSRNVLLAGYEGGSYALVVNGKIPLPHAVFYGVPILYHNLLNYSGPPLAPGAFYFFDNENDYIIGTGLSNGSIIAYRWPAGFRMNPPIALSFDTQITDVLHDGTLLARGKITTGAYDTNGQELYTLPTGNYRFIHELSDGVAYYSYFTRTVVVPDSKDDWKGEISFDVFRCPTDQLSTLAD